jgi:hypothetical protein
VCCSCELIEADTCQDWENASLDFSNRGKDRLHRGICFASYRVPRGNAINTLITPVHDLGKRFTFAHMSLKNTTKVASTCQLRISLRLSNTIGLLG